ncbi:MAG TPA: ABC transporter substrate-binding protein [Chloroflexota bacterium]|jgi:NitT/TauT family transport system substrate-binding protein
MAAPLLPEVAMLRLTGGDWPTAWRAGGRALAGLLLALGAVACAPAASPAPAAPAPQAAPPASAPAPAPAATAPPALESIRIGYPSYSIGYLPLFAADKQGYYQEQGLSAELVEIRPAAGITALINGDIEYLAGFASTIRAALSGAPAKIVLMTARAPLFSLLGRPEYASVEQLRGHTVGITTFGGTVDVMTRVIFKSAGLDSNQDVQLLQTGDAPVLYEALRRGQVEAALLPLPFPLLARADGYRILVNAAELVSMPTTGLGVMQARLDGQRDQVKRAAKSQVQAVRFIHARPDDAIRLSAELFDMDLETARQSFELFLPAISEDGTVEPEGVDTVLEAELEAGKDLPRLPFEQLVDASLAPEAQRELGLK